MPTPRAPLVAAALLFAYSAHAQDGQPRWRQENGTQRVFSAAAWGSNSTRMVVECRTPAFSSAELGLTVAGGDWHEGRDGTLRLRSGDAAFEVPVARLDQGGGSIAYRWVTGDGKAVEHLARFAQNALGLLRVETPDGAAATFGQSEGGFDRLADTVARCLPSVVRVRARAAETRAIDRLITLERDANDRCRGGSGDDVLPACAERSEYGERLYALGMCYGREGEAGYQQQWHRCGPRSIRP